MERLGPGKVSRAFFDEHLVGRVGAERADTRLGPTHGADFGLVDARGTALAMASDPLFFLRDLGAERAGWFACQILLSDAALSGLAPAHLAVSVTLPLDADPAEFGRLWAAFDRTASDAGVSVTTGHTGAYEGCSYPTVGGGTALALGDHADVVLPTGASPGDRLVVTKGPAIETVGTLAVLFGDELDVPEGAVDAARERFAETSLLADALAAARAGPVTAMHDATERGLANALHELATASGVGLDVARERVPVGEGVRAVCSALGIDPWTASSAGTVVMSVAPGGADAVLAALDAAGVRAAEVGTATAGGEVFLDGERLPEPDSDPFWPAYTALRERAAPDPTEFAFPEPYTSKV
jgi:hydrogenase expression/formation protein HypE